MHAGVGTTGRASGVRPDYQRDADAAAAAGAAAVKGQYTDTTLAFQESAGLTLEDDKNLHLISDRKSHESCLINL